MPDHTTPSPAATPISESADAPLPQVATRLGTAAIVERLTAAAKRGKMAGFAPGKGAELFAITDFGRPFESRLTATAGPGVETGTTALRFALALKPMMPVIFAVVTVLTVWPGVWLTDSLLRTYFTGYNIPTWWWYLPLTGPTGVWGMMSALKKSRRSGREAAAEIIAKIAELVEGETASDPRTK